MAETSIKTKALTTLAIIMGLCTALAWVTFSFGTVGSAIYGLYEWGGNDIPLAQALWSAAKVWMVCVGGGFVFGMLGTVGTKFVDEVSKASAMNDWNKAKKNGTKNV